jgi:hypothetical protein
LNGQQGFIEPDFGWFPRGIAKINQHKRSQKDCYLAPSRVSTQAESLQRLEQIERDRLGLQERAQRNQR